MRPRVFPAEDEMFWIKRALDALASMRPRVFPAEDSRCPATEWTREARFNEAAGIPRGRRGGHRVDAGDGVASMRPRVFPAEDRP